MSFFVLISVCRVVPHTRHAFVTYLGVLFEIPSQRWYDEKNDSLLFMRELCDLKSIPYRELFNNKENSMEAMPEVTMLCKLFYDGLPTPGRGGAVPELRWYRDLTLHFKLLTVRPDAKSPFQQPKRWSPFVVATVNVSQSQTQTRADGVRQHQLSFAVGGSQYDGEGLCSLPSPADVNDFLGAKPDGKREQSNSSSASKSNAAVTKPSGTINRSSLIVLSSVSSRPLFLGFTGANGTWTEDDILHCQAMPTFRDALSQDDAERLMSYLTAPYIRLPLVASFLADRDKLPVLFQSKVQALLETVFCETGNWGTAYPFENSASAQQLVITSIPAPRTVLNQPFGALLTELLFNATGSGVLTPLLTLSGVVLSDLDTRTYRAKACVPLALLLIRLLVRVQTVLLYLLEWHKQPAGGADSGAGPLRSHPAAVMAAAPPATIELLQKQYANTRSLLEGPFRALLDRWIAQAERTDPVTLAAREADDAVPEPVDTANACVFHAYRALIYRNVPVAEWTPQLLTVMMSRYRLCVPLFDIRTLTLWLMCAVSTT